MTYKKGHVPHNKGDTYVDEHYRDRPKKKTVARKQTATPWEYDNYYNQLGNNFLKRWFS